MIYFAKDVKVVPFLTPRTIRIVHGAGRVKEVKIIGSHVRNIEINRKVVNHRLYYPKLQTTPRVAEEIWIPPAEVKKRPRWTIGISVFRNYK